MPSLFASQDNESLEAVLHSIGDAMCVTDKDMVFVAANLHCANFYGLDDPAKLLGKHALEVYPQFRQSVFYEACARTAQTGETTTRYGFSANINRWVVIRCYKFRENRYAMVVHMVSDGTSKAGYVPQFDTLTSLPNRGAFEQDITSLHEHLQQTSLLLIDISHFRDINEKLGFQEGDKALMEVAARLRMGAEKSDRVYRVGNDQFLVMGEGSLAQMKARHDRLSAELTAPLLLAGQEYVLRFTMGACETSPSMAGPKLLTHAERALAHAKSLKITYAEYRDDLESQAFDPAMNKDFRDALSNNELAVVFQPQVDLIDGKPCSAEALVRWKHPTRGMVPPSDFLPFAEEMGLIGEVDRIVAGKTLDMVAHLQRQRLEIAISFNLSAQSVCDESVVEFIHSELQRTGARPKNVGVEITETSIMRDVAVSQRVIEGLKGLGLHVSIDDFGSGYSSMAYLLRYPSHFLKIDRAFIQDMRSEGSHGTMVKNLIGLAHGLGMGVVAEGVETEEDAQLLKEMDCDMAQGYYFARPMPGDELEAWLSKKGVTSLDSLIR